jgi:hypothetical protein
MKINFRKISAVIASSLMTVSAVGFAAAANFPAPFVVGGSADAAVVYGTGAGALDQTPANSIGNYLASKVTVGSGEPTGDSILIEGTNNHLNMGDTWAIFTGKVDDNDLPTLLGKGTYVATDNDEFDYKQYIELGAPTLSHFRDSTYEDLVGLDDNTPSIGFRMTTNTYVLNYTLDFVQNAQSDVSGTDLEDIEGSDLTLFGKTYYVSDIKNSSSTGTDGMAGKLTLLDSATVATVNEGETVTVTSGGKTYEVSISFIDSDEVKFMVNGQEASVNKLKKGDSAKLSDGSYIGVRDISKLEVSGETGSASFSIGSGKLEITSGDDIKLNDDTIEGVKGYVQKGTSSGGVEEIDKIVIQWKTDDEQYLTPAAELEMPGFGGLKFTMAQLARNEEEKVSITESGDAIELGVPLESGTANFKILYAETQGGNISGIGEDSTHRLATSGSNVLTYFEATTGGAEYDEYFVATYNTSSVSESYLLEATVSKGTTSDDGNKTTIKDAVDGTVYCEDYTTSDGTCDIGSNIVLTLSDINYTASGIESVTFTAGTDVNFHTMYTAGGLKIDLPYVVANSTLTTANGAINYTNFIEGSNGHDQGSFWLFMTSENKDEDVAAGTEFNVTIDAYGSLGSSTLQVSQVDGSGSSGYEIGTGTGDRETYIVDDVAPRIMHYTKGDPDYAEVYYPTGDSETYAKVYLTSASATLSAAGSMVFKDSEKSSWSNKNVVVVGGSCINSAAADLLGGDLCEGAFTDATGVGAGQYVVESFADGFSSGKIALLVAGYHAADTVAAASRLIEPGVSVDTTAGTKYIGTVGVSGSSTMSKVE